MRFRSKKVPPESMALLSKYYKNGILYKGFWRHKDTGPLPAVQSCQHDILATLSHNSKLVHKHCHIFFTRALPLAMRTGIQTEKVKKLWSAGSIPKSHIDSCHHSSCSETSGRHRSWHPHLCHT